jgi:hypothetical protein
MKEPGDNWMKASVKGQLSSNPGACHEASRHGDPGKGNCREKMRRLLALNPTSLYSLEVCI